MAIHHRHRWLHPILDCNYFRSGDLAMMLWDYPIVENLSRSLDLNVHRIPDTIHSCSDGTSIFLANRYVERIGDTEMIAKRKVTATKQSVIFKRSQAIYFLLHEHGHVLQHRQGTVAYPDREHRANVHAAAFFRNYCRTKLLISVTDTSKLWQALPEHYRKPTGV